MVRLRTLSTVAALMACSLVPALAQNAPIDMRTGLWEVSTQRATTGMPKMPAMPAIPPAALAQMPPAQRAQIEAMLKARRGAVSGKHVAKVCVTAASLRKGAAFGMPHKANCERTKNVRTTHGWDIQEVCHQDGGRQSMNIHYEVVNRETLQGAVNIAMHERGHDITMKQVSHGRWLGPDCGKVKPVE